MRFHDPLEVPARQSFEQFRDNDVFLRMVAERQGRIHVVNIPSSRLLSRNIPCPFQVRNNFMHCSLGYLDLVGYLTSSAGGIVVYVAEHETVVSDESPPR